jgi:nitrite reductase/ring-hydroxylating ferredoxin subunit
MMSEEANQRVTRTDAGTPAGNLMRLYWQPVALTAELDGPRPVKAVRLLGQDFVLFRDPQGRYGLLDRACPHRGADLAFGRLEDGGLRCVFHGWLFDAAGRCLETPAEPDGSTLCRKVRVGRYPVIERSGILFAYLGAGLGAGHDAAAPPVLPDFDCFVAPDSHVFAFKGHIAANWLQALEVGIDPAHASFLHRFFEDEDPAEGYGRQFRNSAADSDIPMTRIMREFPRPQIEVEQTDYGLRLFTLRRIDDARTHLRVTNLCFPHGFVIPLSSEMTITQLHVPIDDTSCYWYAIFTSFGAPVDQDAMRRQRLALYSLPDYKPRIGRANDYGFDAAEQRDRTYTGMGFDINVHDQWAVESQGPIHDRTREHLGYSDKAITAYRRLLLAAIDQAERGERPLMVLDEAQAARVRGPATLDGIGPTENWSDYWQDSEAKRRAGSSWGAAA